MACAQETDHQPDDEDQIDRHPLLKTEDQLEVKLFTPYGKLFAKAYHTDIPNSSSEHRQINPMIISSPTAENTVQIMALAWVTGNHKNYSRSTI